VLLLSLLPHSELVLLLRLLLLQGLLLCWPRRQPAA
jgi:hypothetical protein